MYEKNRFFAFGILLALSNNPPLELLLVLIEVIFVWNTKKTKSVYRRNGNIVETFYNNQRTTRPVSCCCLAYDEICGRGRWMMFVNLTKISDSHHLTQSHTEAIASRYATGGLHPSFFCFTVCRRSKSEHI